jgi:glycosyltransferase involved in cell wall biosynthesis
MHANDTMSTMFKQSKPKVVCVHIGARAHYLIPVALERLGCLQILITDTWIQSKWLRAFLFMMPITSVRSLAGRYATEIPSHHVHSFSWNSVFFELKLRVKHLYNWESTLLRDSFFEHKAVEVIKKCNDADLVLGISYTALEVFKIAKSKGMRTVLFQIDPGLYEENLVAQLIKVSGSISVWERAPQIYWERWKEECVLADSIFVNSQWSKDGLIQYGIPQEKISIIPLPYTIQRKHVVFQRTYPTQFNTARPLRCLFLGTLALRKGIHLLIDAAKALVDCPIEFIFVGRSEIDIENFSLSNIAYKGIVPREAVDAEYQAADLFLFPTISDGFGLTQLEAMAWQLPVVTTSNCGDVVRNDYNGWIIPSESVIDIVHVLKEVLMEPQKIQSRSSNCLGTVQEFSADVFASNLAKLL